VARRSSCENFEKNTPPLLISGFLRIPQGEIPSSSLEHDYQYPACPMHMCIGSIWGLASERVQKSRISTFAGEKAGNYINTESLPIRAGESQKSIVKPLWLSEAI
jgi:hypothetical protein